MGLEISTKVKYNILVFPGGMENGLEIYHSLRYCKEVRLFSASSPILNHADYVYKNNFTVRDVRTEGWVDDLNRIVSDNKIDLIFPANSLVIDYLIPFRDEILAPILLPESSVVELTRSKRNTLDALKNSVSIPRFYSSLSEITQFPVFCKPDKGYGSQGAFLAVEPEQLKKINFKDFIVQEFLPGKEYTIDCFSNQAGELLFCGGRERSRVRMATSMHAEAVSSDLENRFKEIAKSIQEKIKISGAWFFQIKEDVDGKLKLLEIDIRIAGTMCFNRCRGVNFPLLSIFDFFGLEVSILLNTVDLKLDRSLRNRYIFSYEYDKVYIDLDDTLIVHGKLNTEAVQFIYQSINNSKKIILISKSLEKDKVGYLKKYRILDLFDEIIWLNEDQSKADFISPEMAIFIDDSFSQRKEVRDRHGIPVFDPSMIEALIDDRY